MGSCKNKKYTSGKKNKSSAIPERCIIGKFKQEKTKIGNEKFDVRGICGQNFHCVRPKIEGDMTWRKRLVE